MRKLSITFNPFKYILLLICLGQLACKKTSPAAESKISKLSFEFIFSDESGLGCEPWTRRL